jgi:hypothetical protein
MVASGLRRIFGAGSHISVSGVAIFLGALGILAAAAAQKADISGLTPQPIEVIAQPFQFDATDGSRETFGRLEWRGGYILSSQSPYFGGYSAIALSADGERIMAISDSGSWLSARLMTKDGRLTGVEDARIGPLTQKDGRPIQRKTDRDAESLAALKPSNGLDGRYYIGFEGRHRIEEYAYREGELRGPVGSIRLPPQLKRMGRNEGLEGIAVMRGGPYAGGLVAFAEKKLTKDGDHTGALIKDGKTYPLFLKRTAEFDITDLAGLKDGSLLVLERSFIRASLKLDIRLRLIPAKAIKPGALMNGEVLLAADRRYRIDNIEGMAVSEDNGETLITLISDDNFNFFQATLLARFALKAE